jgi:dipeptidyl aminopeptidase/acylaminoacyl peptidase
MQQTKPFGSWKSPITSDLIVAGAIRLSEIQLDGEDVYWIEGRAAEKGRNVIVRRTPDRNIEDAIPEGFNARTRVHEYGGGSYAVKEGLILFTDFRDQLIYFHKADGSPRQFSPIDFDQARFANFCIMEFQLVCVCEDHYVPPEKFDIEVKMDPFFGESSDIKIVHEPSQLKNEPVNSIISFSFEKERTDKLLCTGADFYSSPLLSPDKSKLCWLQWNHPNMPWDATQLFIGEFSEDNSLINIHLIAGGETESICQPEWSPNGILHFISDRTGWWNLYRFVNGNVEALCPMEAEFGVPHWVFRQSQYAFIDETHIICAYIEKGFFRLGILNTETKELEKIETSYTMISSVRATATKAYFIAASTTESSAVIEFDLASRQFTTIRKSTDLGIDSGYISIPQAAEFPTTLPTTNHQQQTTISPTAHAFYYPPTNKDFVAPDGELPPLIVEIHGGPTSQTYPIFSLGHQYWTSRGFAVLDVNYGGSTGYGREYRERLRHNWGVVDVNDCVNGAKYLVEQGLADPKRLCITGGSAGGYTTLAALTFKDIFSAGASHYGVSDLQALDEDTHKFESRYTFGLVPKELYHERSPIHHTDKLNAPVIFFQGLEDKVVPPNQAEMMVDALRQKGLPVAYVTFAEEGHGFRQSENIKRALDGELYFYSRVFGFALADEVEPVEIENL